jgi:C-terminal processing protease CtpA/Prc
MLFFHIMKATKRGTFLTLTGLIMLCCACSTPHSAQYINKKYAPEQLLQDFDIMQKTYQTNHPSYDWYTSKDSVDQRFKIVRNSIQDSLTESEFRAKLAYTVALIRCGHTSVMASKAYREASKKVREPIFPLIVKVWGDDSMVVLQNLLGDTTPLNRGTVITSINEVPVSELLTQMKEYTSTDGYYDGFRDIQVGAGFAPRFKWLYGLPSKYRIIYLDTNGSKTQTIIPNYIPRKDSISRLVKIQSLPVNPKPAIQKREGLGNLKIDTANSLAIMTLNNFSTVGFRKFIRTSFKKIKENNLKNMVIELRGNGGGKIHNSTYLTRFIINKPFSVADSASAKNLKLAYPRYTQAAWIYKYLRWMFVTKQKDGRYHMQKTERRTFNPKERLHFKGELFVITGGATFSASTLFLGKVLHQNNVTTVGEETGGGARGNSAIMVPKVTLPNTGVQVRLPLFRLISDVSLPNNGRGIMPSVPVPPNSYYIKNDVDPKMEKVIELTHLRQQKDTSN